MTNLLEVLLTLLILVNFLLVGSSRLVFSIRLLAVQGIAVGVLPLVLPGHDFAVRHLFLAAGTVLLKGLVFPWLLLQALRAAGVQHEAVPRIGYSPSIIAAVLGLGVSVWLASRFKLPLTPPHPLLLATALFTVLLGLFLIVTRNRAITQVMGYLILENGIFLFGIQLARSEPLLVEMGVLLDVFVAVFVMGITIFHISREFDHIDVDQLSLLRD